MRRPPTKAASFHLQRAPSPARCCRKVIKQREDAAADAS